MSASVSDFLPYDYSGQAIGLIAGKGSYPVLTAERSRDAGLPLRLISFMPKENHVV